MHTINLIKIIMFFAILTGTAFSLPVISSQNPDLLAAVALYESGQFSEAADSLESLITFGDLSDEEILEAREILAYSYVADGKAEAKRLFEQILSNDPNYQVDTDYATKKTNTVWSETYLSVNGSEPDQSLERLFVTSTSVLTPEGGDLELGKMLYKAGDYSGAMVALNRYLQRTDTTQEQKSSTEEYLGYCSYSLGYNESTIEHFRKMLEFDPDHTLDSNYTTPEMIILFEQAKKEFEAESSPLGTININSTPTGAEIKLDGDVIGKTPLTESDVELGKHKIEASLNGYKRYKKNIVVASGVNGVDVTLTVKKPMSKKWLLYGAAGAVAAGAGGYLIYTATRPADEIVQIGGSVDWQLP